MSGERNGEECVCVEHTCLAGENVRGREVRGKRKLRNLDMELSHVADSCLLGKSRCFIIL